MATRVIYSRDLVAQASIQYIRAQTLTLSLDDARPNTKMYVFFDGENVTDYCYRGSVHWQADTQYVAGQVINSDTEYYKVLESGLSGSTVPSHTSGTTVANGTVSLKHIEDIWAEPLTSDAAGQGVFMFQLPAETFNCGDREIIIADTPNLDDLEQTGSVFGSARTMFSAVGILEIFQPKITAVTTVVRVIPRPSVDPLAQSFFTYGVKGGIFLTSVDLYFQTKDEELPVSVEIRPMTNGYPAPLASTSPSLISTLNAADIEVSSDASVPTKFTFDPPIYLKEEADYCFVIRSNSKYYNVFTSRMGERSIEDGRKIFEQPYVGSLFKSENNITWNAEMMDDVKFKINKAKFNTATETILDFGAIVPHVAAYGEQFSTVAGSTTVTYRHNHEHGLEVGSLFEIVTHTDALYTNAKFNGIPYTDFNKVHTVTNVLDRNTIQFVVDTPADATGKLESADIITELKVTAGGMQYLSTDTVVFSYGDAAATLEVTSGVVTGVTLTNAGTGYTTPPTVTIERNGGQGGNGLAKISASVQPAFSVVANKPMTGATAKILISNYDTTSTVNKLTTTVGNYGDLNLTSYSAGKTYEINEFFPYMNFGQNSLVASKNNEGEAGPMNGQRSSVLSVQLKTENPNVSPVINLNVRPTLNAYNTRINSQTSETLTATNGSGSIATLSISAGGSGYVTQPTITISAPDLEDGVQATASVTISGGAVNGVAIVEAGSGYTSIPTVTITRGDTEETGTTAAVAATLTPYNTELLATGGKAKARYITKKTGIQIVSTGVRVLSAISSVKGSSVDWYIRTSLSGKGVIHDDQPWRILSCDVPRDKSSYIGEMFDYEFKLDDIPEFDTYDLKCVLTSNDPTKAPVVESYRTVVVA